MKTSDMNTWVKDFLDRPLIARMATASLSGQPHVVPVWYGWDGKSLWISSFVSTRKFQELEQNPNMAVVIDEVDTSGNNRAVIFEGNAELIAEPREFVRAQSIWIYTRYMGEEGVKSPDPQNWSGDPENRLIRLTPNRMITKDH